MALKSTINSNLVFIVLLFRFPQAAILFLSPDRSANFAGEEPEVIAAEPEIIEAPHVPPPPRLSQTGYQWRVASVFRAVAEFIGVLRHGRE
jgi:hypothetical protein